MSIATSNASYPDRLFLKDAFLNMPIAAQWLTISTAKSIVASVLMSFVASYATIYFAVKSGFRAPVEGVPYLKLVIGLGTFAIFMATLAAFAILLILFRWVRNQLSSLRPWILELPLKWLFGKKREQKINDFFSRVEGEVRNFIKHNIFIAIGILIYFAGIVCLFRPDTGADMSELISRVSGGYISIGSKFTFQVPAMLFVGSAVYVSIWSVGRGLGWIAAQVFGSIMVFGIAASALFMTDVYGSFLRVIRFGGGIAVRALIQEEANAPPRTMDGYLLLITEKSVILYIEHEIKIKELPMRNIAELQADTQPTWKLPPYSIERQNDFLKIDLLMN
jgi:hypothetical protein